MAKKYQYYVTYSMLVRLGACVNQRRIFFRLFGDKAQVPVTRENIALALRDGMDVYWLYTRLRNKYYAGRDREALELSGNVLYDLCIRTWTSRSMKEIANAYYILLTTYREAMSHDGR